MDTAINWDDVIKKEARGIDDLDLGEVQGVSEDKVVVQKGIIDKNTYHLPKSRIKSYDKEVLRFDISESELMDYEIESSPPSVTEQYLSTTDINSRGGSSGGIQIENDTRNSSEN